MNFVYYKDNPELGRVLVTTIHGTKEYHGNCKRFEDGYYVKGVDLEYDGRIWVKKPPIDAFDHEKGVEAKNAINLINGVVGFDADNKEIYGNFSPNPYNNCNIVDAGGLQRICINPAILSQDLYMEDVSVGMYYRVDKYTEAQKKNLKFKKLVIDNRHKTYNIEDDKAYYEKLQGYYQNNVVKPKDSIKYAGRYLGDLSFGLELETINGTLPEYICNRYGIVICKDGSIKDGAGHYPPEYVTVPYKGARGLQSITELCAEIQKRSEINVQCSCHVHFGGFTIDRVMLVSLFRLCYKIQGDVFKMFPGYKLKPDGVKQQNYCQQLPNILTSFGKKNFNNYINKNFKDMYAFLSGGRVCDDKNNMKAKNNPWGKNKWDMKTRYYWINFVNPFFGKRNTIEFRIHTPTLNANKIINWIFMCAAILKFAEAHLKRCINKEKITFEEVLNFYGEAFKTNFGRKLSENLIAYYKERVAYFEKDVKRGDNLSPKELLEDGEFKFLVTE